jgi:hypothetical protein
MKIDVNPVGMIRLAPGTGRTGPEGFKRTPKGRKRVSTRGPYGCLMGRIGPGGTPFTIKKKKVVTARSCGQLYLLVNDADPSTIAGEFIVSITLK